MTIPAQNIVDRLQKPLPTRAIGNGRHGDTIVDYDYDAIETERTEAADTISRLTADNEALREDLAEARAAHHRTSHKAVKRLRVLWREKQAAESRLTADNEALTKERDEAVALYEAQIAAHRLSAKDATKNLIRATTAEAQFEEMTRSCIAERASRLAAETRVTALEADVERLRERLESGAALLDVLAEDAQKRDDTATWSMTAVMAETLRAALGGSGHG